ncbi:hypothetical protein [Planosporangium mesophilum]|uniref:Uncharacterized protein n=1 Tax=Planosporangium mesophilum TaxID=689768 RepID=A0A8J3THB1_9ACTN|nr:hypothetical protein [Planosporangium mesophilum]NJC84319.1 hypothetical protein [Planosporangium mesophilum]GII25591.1 hypothetical protein Pme01_51880 [Planosporangium mesophilum]
MSGNYGWFTYGRNPSGKVWQWTITRAPDDPPIVVWRVDDTTWIVDDDVNDQCALLNGFSEAEVEAALMFARALIWIPAGTEYVFRELGAAS